MIANITKGSKAYGALAYDFGPGRRDEHENARVVAGNVPGTWRQAARIIDHHTKQKDLEKPIWRCSLSLPDEDGVLEDPEFADIATAYVERMGFGGCPWVAVRHGDDHIHLTVSRVGWDGKTVDDHADFRRSRPIVRALEQEHGLVNADERSNRAAPQVGGTERAASKRRGAIEPEREQIRAMARAARDAAAGRGRAGFEEELTRLGVDFRANVASTGKMNGYSFSLPTWRDADDQQIWVTASKTAKDLAWNQLDPVLGPSGDQPAPEAADPARHLLASLRDRSQAPPVDQRPLGLLSDAALLQQRTAAARLVADRQKHLADAETVGRRIEAQIAGLVPGARLAELAERRERLEAAVGHLGEAAQHRSHAEAAETRNRAAQQVAAEAEKQAQRPALVLRATGTSRAQQEDIAATARRFAAESAQAASAGRDAQARAEAAARAMSGQIADPAGELAKLAQRWSQEVNQARREDASFARSRRADHATAIQTTRVSLAQVKQQLHNAEEELRLRDALPAARKQAEDQARAEFAARQRAHATPSGPTARRSTPSREASAARQQPPQHSRDNRQRPGRRPEPDGLG